MRKLLPLLIVGFLAATALFAQQATFTTPVVRPSEDNMRVESIFLTREAGGRWEAIVSVRDSGGTEIRRASYTGPDSGHATATALAFVTAQMTAVGGETGNNARRMDLRVLTFLRDQNYIGAGAGQPVSLVP